MSGRAAGSAVHGVPELDVRILTATHPGGPKLNRGLRCRTLCTVFFDEFPLIYKQNVQYFAACGVQGLSERVRIQAGCSKRVRATSRTLSRAESGSTVEGR